jgi:hypothetical protein
MNKNETAHILYPNAGYRLPVSTSFSMIVKSWVVTEVLKIRLAADWVSGQTVEAAA